MSLAVVIDMKSPDHEWAEAEFAAIAAGVGSVHDHIRSLYDHWTEGRNVQRFYINEATGQLYESPASAFASEYPEVMTKRNIQNIGQTHRVRRLLGGVNRGSSPSEKDVTDRALRIFGDPTKWDADELRDLFVKAQAIAAERIATMEAKGRRASRGVITGDILEAMGRPRSVGTTSVEYWHHVLDSLTTGHAGLDASMATRIAATAIWAAPRF